MVKKRDQSKWAAARGKPEKQHFLILDAETCLILLLSEIAAICVGFGGGLALGLGLTLLLDFRIQRCDPNVMWRLFCGCGSCNDTGHYG